MLKTRLIPCLLLQNGLLVRSEGFSLPPDHRQPDQPGGALQRVGGRRADLPRHHARGRATTCAATTTRSRRRRPADDHRGDLAHLLHAADVRRRDPHSRTCRRPLRPRRRQGDGQHRRGRDPELVTEAARKFGSQAIVVSIDAEARATGELGGRDPLGRQATGLDVVEWARRGRAARCRRDLPQLDRPRRHGRRLRPRADRGGRDGDAGSRSSPAAGSALRALRRRRPRGRLGACRPPTSSTSPSTRPSARRRRWPRPASTCACPVFRSDT